MSVVDESRPGDQRLIRYLLGLLPDEDAERLDEASITDDEVAARLLIVEDELVEDYLSDRLSGESLERFESFYLSSPRRRQAVRFARDLRHAANRIPGSPRTGMTSGAPRAPVHHQQPLPSRRSSSGLRIVLRWIPRRTLAAAAALLLLASGALLLQRVRLRSGPDDGSSQRVAAERAAHELEQRVDDQRAGDADAVGESSRLGQSSGSSQAPGAVAVVLFPQTRSAGPIATVAPPPDADRVMFELRLESNEFPRYQVALRDPAASQTVWRSGWLAAAPSGDHPAVSVIVPVKILKPQHYSLELIGQDGAESSRIAGSYAVQVVPR
jgi:hypothetical protein